MIENGKGIPGHNKPKSPKTTLLMAGRNSNDTKNNTHDSLILQENIKDIYEKYPLIEPEFSENHPLIAKIAYIKLKAMYLNPESIPEEFMELAYHPPKEIDGKFIPATLRRIEARQNIFNILIKFIQTLNYAQMKCGKYGSNNNFMPYTSKQFCEWLGICEDTFYDHFNLINKVCLVGSEKSVEMTHTEKWSSLFAVHKFDMSIFTLVGLDVEFLETRRVALEVQARRDKEYAEKRAQLKQHEPLPIFAKIKEFLLAPGKSLLVKIRYPDFGCFMNYLEKFKNHPIAQEIMKVLNKYKVKSLSNTVTDTIQVESPQKHYVDAVLALTDKIMDTLGLSKQEAFNMAKSQIPI